MIARMKIVWEADIEYKDGHGDPEQAVRQSIKAGLRIHLDRAFILTSPPTGRSISGLSATSNSLARSMSELDQDRKHLERAQYYSALHPKAGPSTFPRL